VDQIQTSSNHETPMTTTAAGTPSKPVDTRGLAGQTVGDTEVCAVTQTELLYRGYEIADLAANATFEEVAFLLLVGKKPTPAELASFKAEVAGMRAIPSSVRDAIVRIAKESPKAHPMSILRTGVSLLSHLDPDCEDNSAAAELRKSKRLLAQIPSIIGACQRTLDGKSPLDPDPSLGHAANLMWLMSGAKPSELAARIMDVSLVLYAEHDFNASTFACRVIASTETDLHSAVCGGIGALKGPLHGGANEMAMEMLKDIDRDCAGGKMTVEQWMKRAFEEKRKLMGFGHRVYKNGDHRSTSATRCRRSCCATRTSTPTWISPAA
jgi:citrate synthase